MMETLFGMPVIQSPVPLVRQKLKVSEDCPMTDAGRDAMNSYLLNMFGEEQFAVVIAGQFVCSGDTIRLLMQNDRYNFRSKQ